MTVNLSELKLQNVRKVINADINGETQEIEVYNLSTEERNELKEKMIKLAQEGIDSENLTEELFVDVLQQCTNIIVDENIIEVLNQPSKSLLLVMKEVFQIIHEVQIECAIYQYQNLCQVESMEYIRLQLLKTQEIEMITQENDKITKKLEMQTKENVSKDFKKDEIKNKGDKDKPSKEV